MKKKELPKIVTINKELLEQVKYFVASMPLESAQKDVKHLKSWDSPDKKRASLALAELNSVAGYLRVLPLFMVGELYTQIQMDIKPYSAETKEDISVDVEDKSKKE